MIESDQRFTPEHVLDVVREFGRIALDPCTTRDNPVGASVFYTEAQDGLAQPWCGLAFWNCPYSRGQTIQWAKRAHEAWEHDRIESIGLVIADTSTQAVQYLLEHANAVAFWKRRIRFAGDASAKFANMLPYFGERQGRFKRVFEPHATVLVLR